jgi:hypothetical protein
MAAMRVSVLALVGGMLAVPLRADLRIAVQETSASRRTTRVEFFKGTLWRYDWDTVGGYWIVDSVSKRTIAVDLAKREYSIQTDTPHGQPIATDPSTTIVIDSGPCSDIESATSSRPSAGAGNTGTNPRPKPARP